MAGQELAVIRCVLLEVAANDYEATGLRRGLLAVVKSHGMKAGLRRERNDKAEELWLLVAHRWQWRSSGEVLLFGGDVDDARWCSPATALDVVVVGALAQQQGTTRCPRLGIVDVQRRRPSIHGRGGRWRGLDDALWPRWSCSGTTRKGKTKFMVAWNDMVGVDTGQQRGGLDAGAASKNGKAEVLIGGGNRWAKRGVRLLSRLWLRRVVVRTEHSEEALCGSSEEDEARREKGKASCACVPVGPGGWLG